MSNDRHLTLVFDGECGFCRRSKGWMERRDHHHLLEWVPLQSDDLAARFPELTRAACEHEIHALDEARHVTRGARAIAEGLRRLAWHWRFVGVLIAFPLAWPSAVVYRWVAKNRRRLGGKNATCAVDLPDGPPV